MTKKPGIKETTDQPINITLSFQDGQVKRKLDDSFTKTDRWEKLKELIGQDERKNILASIYKKLNHGDEKLDEVINGIFSNAQTIFASEQELPWYLDLIALKLKGENNKRCKLTIKSCEGYLFLALYDISNPQVPKLFLPPFFHMATPRHTPLEKEEQRRGIADTLLILAPRIADISEVDLGKYKNVLNDLLCWFEINLYIKEISRDDSSLKLEFIPEVYWVSSSVDEKKRCINLESLESKDKLILVASQNFRAALYDLSETWHVLDPKSVLLCAWTGSGKEPLKKALTYALDLKNDQIFEFSAPDIASEERPFEEIYKSLNKKKVIIGRRAKRECKRCLLFFDEIHQDSAKRLREILLRFIETKELYNEIESIDCKKAILLFAGSKPPEEIRTKEPPDFWTRIQKTVLLKHPLLLDSRRDRRNTLIQYFCLFWRETAKEAFETKKLPESIKKTFKCLTNPDYLEGWSNAFANELDSALIPIISIRTIRSIVTRLFNRAIYHIITIQLKRDKEILEAIKDKLPEWIVDIFKELAPEINPKEVF